MQKNPSSSCGSGEESRSSQCDRLVQKVLSSSGQERDDALTRLLNLCVIPLAKRIAWRRCFSKQRAEDFLDQVPGYMFEKLSYFDPQQGYSFLAWCSRVLKNLAIDMGKKEERRREILSSDWDEAFSGDPKRNADAEFVLEIVSPDPSIVDQVSRLEKLPAQKVAILETMPPLQRVIVVAMAGLVPRVNSEVWNRWLDEAGVEHPFPPPKIYDFDEPIDRVDCIAEALGMKRDAVRQHWYRGVKVLRKLFGEQ